MTTTETEAAPGPKAEDDNALDAERIERQVASLQSLTRWLVLAWHAAFASCSIAAIWTWSTSAIVACLLTLILLPVTLASLVVAHLLAAFLWMKAKAEIDKVIAARMDGATSAGTRNG